MTTMMNKEFFAAATAFFSTYSHCIALWLAVTALLGVLCLYGLRYWRFGYRTSEVRTFVVVFSLCFGAIAAVYMPAAGLPVGFTGAEFGAVVGLASAHFSHPARRRRRAAT